MGLTAVMLALLGFSVDVVCYSRLWCTHRCINLSVYSFVSPPFPPSQWYYLLGCFRSMLSAGKLPCSNWHNHTYSQILVWPRPPKFRLTLSTTGSRSTYFVQRFQQALKYNHGSRCPWVAECAYLVQEVWKATICSKELCYVYASWGKRPLN